MCGSKVLPDVKPPPRLIVDPVPIEAAEVAEVATIADADVTMG
jgi:hypothetical protein